MMYVAMGDSISAGTGCADGEAWPDRLAERLRLREPALELRNLSVPGAGSSEVMKQLPMATHLKPDLVTVVFGANDILLRTRPDPVAYEKRLRAVLAGLRSSDATGGRTILTSTTPVTLQFMPLRPRTRKRVEEGLSAVNEATRRVASACEVPVLEIARHDDLSDPSNFSDDGLHPSRLGHERLADAFAELLHASGYAITK